VCYFRKIYRYINNYKTIVVSFAKEYGFLFFVLRSEWAPKGPHLMPEGASNKTKEAVLLYPTVTPRPFEAHLTCA
jgi:hypothetical protein